MRKSNSNKVELFTNLSNRKNIILYGINNETSLLAGKVQSVMDAAVLSGYETKTSSPIGVLVLSDEYLAGQSVAGQVIIPLHEAIVQIRRGDSLLVICSLEQGTSEKIRKRLLLEGLKENEDFFSKDIFMDLYLSVWAWHSYGIVFADVIGQVTSFACTLKCKYCSVSLPYLHEARTKKEDIYREIDRIFELFDVVYTYDLTSGETFLISEQIADIIEYLCTNYSGRFYRILMVTNATVIPSDRCLEVLTKYRDFIHISISDYSVLEGWKENFEKLYNILDANGINCDVSHAETWIDFGFMDTFVDGTKEEIETYFDMCQDSCKGVIKGRLYWCVHGFGAAKAFYPEEITEEDSLNIFSENINKELIVEWMMGVTKQGYMNICRHCNGYGPGRNHNYIPVAEQL